MKRDPKKGKSCRRANQTSHLVINDGDFEFEKVYFRDHYSIDLGSLFFQTEADIFSNEEEIFSLLERQEEVIAQARLMDKNNF